MLPPPPTSRGRTRAPRSAPHTARCPRVPPLLEVGWRHPEDSGILERWTDLRGHRQGDKGRLQEDFGLGVWGALRRLSPRGGSSEGSPAGRGDHCGGQAAPVGKVASGAARPRARAEDRPPALAPGPPGLRPLLSCSNGRGAPSEPRLFLGKTPPLRPGRLPSAGAGAGRLLCPLCAQLSALRQGVPDPSPPGSDPDPPQPRGSAATESHRREGKATDPDHLLQVRRPLHVGPGGHCPLGPGATSPVQDGHWE